MKQIQIDGAKLLEIIQAKGLTGSEVGRNLGYSDNYVSNAKRRNQVSQIFVDLLYRDYDISYDEYKPAEETVEEKQEETAESTTERPETQEVTLSKETIDKLFETIMSAVIWALVKCKGK